MLDQNQIDDIQESDFSGPNKKIAERRDLQRNLPFQKRSDHREEPIVLKREVNAEQIKRERKLERELEQKEKLKANEARRAQRERKEERKNIEEGRPRNK